MWESVRIFRRAVSFDAMGMTDNENPLGLMPFFTPGVPIGGKKKRRRRRREEEEDESMMEPHLVAGGER